MEIPRLPTPEESFDTFDELKDRVMLAAYLDIGYPIKQKTTKGDTRDPVSRKWKVRTLSAQHDHPKYPALEQNPRHIGVTHGRTVELLRGFWTKVHNAENRSLSAAAPSVAGTPTPSRPQRRSASPARTPNPPRHQPRRAVSPELGVEPEDKKPRIDEVLVLSDDDEDNDGESLANFLESLGTSFKLAKHANLFRDPKIGVSTKEQLLEVAETHLEQLVEIVQGKMGFGPAMALKKGLQKELEK
ncbi:hypothetical protein JCM3765_007374 [Sporobolomyces pararoseus]